MKARCQASAGLLPWTVHYEIIDEPGFGGGVDEELGMACEAVLNVLLGNPCGQRNRTRPKTIPKSVVVALFPWQDIGRTVDIAC